jgi:flagellin
MLTVAEGGLNSIMDILQSMKEKTVQAANDTMGSTERTAIKNELDALSAEIGDILSDTTYNGTALFATANVSLTFQVNAENGDTFSTTINSTSVGGLSVATSNLLVASAASAGATLALIDAAITTISSRNASIEYGPAVGVVTVLKQKNKSRRTYAAALWQHLRANDRSRLR